MYTGVVNMHGLSYTLLDYQLIATEKMQCIPLVAAVFISISLGHKCMSCNDKITFSYSEYSELYVGRLAIIV